MDHAGADAAASESARCVPPAQTVPTLLHVKYAFIVASAHMEWPLSHAYDVWYDYVHRFLPLHSIVDVERAERERAAPMELVPSECVEHAWAFHALRFPENYELVCADAVGRAVPYLSSAGMLYALAEVERDSGARARPYVADIFACHARTRALYRQTHGHMSRALWGWRDGRDEPLDHTEIVCASTGGSSEGSGDGDGAGDRDECSDVERDALACTLRQCALHEWRTTRDHIRADASERALMSAWGRARDARSRARNASSGDSTDGVDVYADDADDADDDGSGRWRHELLGETALDVLRGWNDSGTDEDADADVGAPPGRVVYEHGDFVRHTGGSHTSNDYDVSDNDAIDAIDAIDGGVPVELGHASDATADIDDGIVYAGLNDAANEDAPVE